VIVGFLLAITKPFRVVTGMLWAPIWTGIKFLSSKVGGWLKNLGTRLFGPTSWLGKQINPKLAKVAMTPKQAIANYNKQLKAGTFGKSGVTGFGGRFSQAMSSARGWLSRIGTKMGPMLSKVGNFFKKLGGILKAIVTNKFVMGAAKFFSRLVAYVIAPIVAIVGMWKGWNATEGGPMANAWGAFKGGINELWEFFIIDFADAIKDIISWIGKKLGFDMAWLDSWSFQELWDTFTDFLSNITEFIGNMLSDLWEGIKSWRPRFLRSNEPDMDPLAGTPATTPPNAFMDMFPANRPANGDNIENFNRMRVRDTGGTDTAAGRAMTAVQNNSTTNNMTNVSVLESVVPGDRWSAELATQYE